MFLVLQKTKNKIKKMAPIPQRKVVSGMLGKTERLKGKKVFPKSCRVAGEFLKSEITPSLIPMGIGFERAMCRSGAQRSADTPQPMANFIKIDFFSK